MPDRLALKLQGGAFFRLLSNVKKINVVCITVLSKR